MYLHENMNFIFLFEVSLFIFFKPNMKELFLNSDISTKKTSDVQGPSFPDLRKEKTFCLQFGILGRLLERILSKRKTEYK